MAGPLDPWLYPGRRRFLDDPGGGYGTPPPGGGGTGGTGRVGRHLDTSQWSQEARDLYAAMTPEQRDAEWQKRGMGSYFEDAAAAPAAATQMAATDVGTNAAGPWGSLSPMVLQQAAGALNLIKRLDPGRRPGIGPVPRPGGGLVGGGARYLGPPARAGVGNPYH